MCGICGYFSNRIQITGEKYYFAHSLMGHRGPDDEGFIDLSRGEDFDFYSGDRSVSKCVDDRYIYTVDSLKKIMSHVRLSIIDLSERGHQPLVSSDGRLALVYNGEVYNYIEIRNELIAKGYSFISDSDTEVVLKSYEEWGIKCFNRFNGMWALAIYDSTTGKIILSRDRFGVKPLFFSLGKDSLIFSSEIKVICNLRDKNTYNENSVIRYLSKCRLCDGKETFITGIYELEPSTTMVIDDDSFAFTVDRYWDYHPQFKPRTLDQAASILKELFEDSIKLRMRSDVEVGTLLSGGLDSSMIAGQMGSYGLLKNYKAYSSVYVEKKYSEMDYIEQTVKRWGLVHYPVYMNADTVLDNLDDALIMCEFPLRAVPMVLQYLLYKKISETGNVKVVLNGQGADECFGGYSSHYDARFFELFIKLQWNKLYREMIQYRNLSRKTIKQILFGMLSCLKYSEFGKCDFDNISYHQLSFPLREYLMYDDRAAMAWGIENRAPFLDYRIVEFAFSLGGELKVNANGNKWAQRICAGDIVEKTIIDRKDKMGFTSPQIEWQKNEWSETIKKTFEIIKEEGLFGINGNALYKKYNDYVLGKNNDWTGLWRIFCMYRYKNAYMSKLIDFE